MAESSCSAWYLWFCFVGAQVSPQLLLCLRFPQNGPLQSEEKKKSVGKRPDFFWGMFLSCIHRHPPPPSPLIFPKPVALKLECASAAPEGLLTHRSLGHLQTLRFSRSVCICINPFQAIVLLLTQGSFLESHWTMEFT